MGRRRLSRVLAWAFLACCAAYVLWLPDIEWLKRINPKTTAYIERYEEDTRARGRRPKVLMLWAPLDAISQHLRYAVIVSEDDMFYRHDGVDWDSIRQAADYDLKKGRLARGGSTITQQLARNLFLTSSKNPLRKLKEMLIARRLERVLGKRRILEIYLNVVEWGDGVYGAQAACRTYYGKDASAVTLDEAIALAAALPSPRRLNPGRKPGPRLLSRRQVLLERMRKLGWAD